MSAVPSLAYLPLPAELWSHVFSFLPLRDLISATHVCHAWRNLALDAPSKTWGQIHWDNSQARPSVLTARLERAGSALVELSIVVACDMGYQTIAQILTERLPQLVFLRLIISSNTSDECCSCLADALTSVPAPHLETFSILANIYIEQPLFANDAPMLRHVELDTVFLDAPDAQLDAVTTVVFSACEIDLGDCISRMLAIFPACEVLKLRAEQFPASDAPRTTEPWPDAFSGLILHACSWSALPPDAFGTFKHTTIPTVEYVVEAGETDRTKRQPFPHGGELPLVNSLRMTEYLLSYESHDNDDTKVVDIGFEDDDGFRRIFSGPYASFRSSISSGFLSKLTSLDVNERDLARRFICDIPPDELGAWSHRGGVMRRIALPFLRRLTLFLLNLSQHEAATNHESPFLLSGAERALSLDLPRLAQLRITCIDQVCIAPEMVSELVEAQFGRGCAGAVPLDLISFHNVRVLENRVDAVANMLALAIDADFLPVPLLRMPSLDGEMPDVESGADF